MFGKKGEKPNVSPTISKAMDKIFLLHADHEQNASTSTVRLAGSTQSNPYACISAGITALWGASHGGANEAMLNLPGKDNCLACHADIKVIMENAVSQHEPVANGVCWDCHTPHSSDYKPFLQAYYPEKFYAPFAEENYNLCFKCHDKSLVTYELTSEATSFRNHNQNLHYFHVNRPRKGRVCKGCHGVHGADQGKLLTSQTIAFGRWAIPLNWLPTDTGAACYVGCHAPKAYDRNNKIRNQ